MPPGNARSCAPTCVLVPSGPNARLMLTRDELDRLRAIVGPGTSTADAAKPGRRTACTQAAQP